jgi:dTDP-4-dehydrorhamnose 3,5-epimerase
MNNLTVIDLPIPGLKKIERFRSKDNRGYFSRIFCVNELQAINFFGKVAQVNQSYTAKKAVIRGMHYQNAPYSENKIVMCLRGKVWDVVVDLRKDSPTFLSHYAEELSEENGSGFLIPRGLAHGFQTLVNNCELLYFHSEIYAPKYEAGIHHLDPRINISWPLPISDTSIRDQGFNFINNNFSGVDYK